MGFIVPGYQLQGVRYKIAVLPNRRKWRRTTIVTPAQVADFNRQWGGSEASSGPDQFQDTNLQPPPQLGRQVRFDDLPPEIIGLIISMSENIDGMNGVNHHLSEFIGENHDSLCRRAIDLHYKRRIPLAVYMNNANDDRTDDDELIVCDESVLGQPYVKFSMLEVDAILPASKIHMLEDEVGESLAELDKEMHNEYMSTYVSSKRLEKKKILRKYVRESAIQFPYKYPELARDLLKLKPVFAGDWQKQLNCLLRHRGDMSFKQLKRFLKRQKAADKKIDSAELVLTILEVVPDKSWRVFLLKKADASSLGASHTLWKSIVDCNHMEYFQELAKYEVSPDPRLLPTLLADNT